MILIYVFKTHVRFHVNWMLFTIQSILFFFLCIILHYENSKFKHLIDGLATDL